MKRLFFTFLLSLVIASPVSASEWITGEVNQRVLAEIFVKEVVNTAMGGETTIRIPNSPVEVTPQTVIAGKHMHCWNSWTYHSDGTKTPKVKCM